MKEPVLASQAFHFGGEIGRQRVAGGQVVEMPLGEAARNRLAVLNPDSLWDEECGTPRVGERLLATGVVDLVMRRTG